MSKIITTIGPASVDLQTLNFFSSHGVQIARLNFSHGSSSWHLQAGKKCQQAGLKIMLDLAGPKILLGNLHQQLEVTAGQKILIEHMDTSKRYPYQDIDLQSKETVFILPCQFNIQDFVKINRGILIDDGKIILKVLEVVEGKVVCQSQNKGVIRSNKGINLPEISVDIDFLIDKDKKMLQQVMPQLRPEYVATSFVKTVEDLQKLRKYIAQVLHQYGIDTQAYFPKICTKIETLESVQQQNLEKIIDNSDMIMIARGDLALEILPIHIKTPFYQTLIGQLCKQKNKPFVVATQMLESMVSRPVPTRAEVSDIYRAVVLEKANYIMLSAESAVGKYPCKAVKIMDSIIKSHYKI